MNLSNELLQLKKQVENLRRDHDQAVGALKQIKERLKREFDCDTLEEAKEMLKELETKTVKLLKEYKTKLAKFKEKYGDQLSTLD